MRHSTIRIRLLLLFACVSLFGTAFHGQAAEPPDERFLRIETGVHTSWIVRVASDAAGRYLVTAGYDKTARVWDAASGQLLSILRPPIDNGNIGQIYSVAMSPDGNIVACSGWTANDSIYIFKRTNGTLLRRIEGLGNVVNHLAFSPDGRYLAASVGGGKGIHLYRTTTWKWLDSDASLLSRSDSVDFAADNRVVSTCQDGFLRLYKASDSGLKLLTKVKAPNGSTPFSARFSPDGNTIAVGYEDGKVVSLLSSIDLSSQGMADSTGVENGDFSSVAWSRDGRFLYAGGSTWKKYDRHFSFFVRRWDQGGKGAYLDFDTQASKSIRNIIALVDGSIVIASDDPSLTMLGADDQLRWRITAPTADFSNNLNGFKLSPDGTTVRFSYERGGNTPHRFALRERSIIPDSDGNGLNPPVVNTPGIDVKNWKNSSPSFKGYYLSLKRYETSSSLAIAPGGSGFAIGTNLYLHFFTSEGKKLWEIPMPGACSAVNISTDGRLVAAALDDGTIRWYRAQDGRELLAFFPHTDRKRWILWTPSGYYDASPGGEDLIGWHVNRGEKNAADFFPASKFRGTYYRPDIIDLVLETLDEDKALRQAKKNPGRKRQQVAIQDVLPPVATILSPLDGSSIAQTNLTLRYNVRTPKGAPVTGIKVLVDGRPISQNRGVKLKAAKTDGEESISIVIPPRDCEITLIAENANAASVPASIRLKWGGQAAKAEEFTILPKLYILAVGVSDYADATLKLGLAAKDARDFASAFARQKNLLYRDVVLKVLTDAQATKDDVLDGLDWLRKETTSKDVAVLFLAGHGVNDPSGIYYYLPHNANTERLMRTGVPFSDIKSTMASIAGKALFFVDTCHSGNVMGSRRAVADINAVVNELSSAENGAVVFASSTGRQYSLEDPKWGNGAFTKALVEGINGKADYTGKGKITINMLDLYLSERVKELTGGKQTPTTTKPQTIQDFPIAVKR